VREYSTPLMVRIPDTGNLTDDVVTNALEHPDDVAFSRPSDGVWRDITTTEFLREVRDVAKGLIAAGIIEGDRVGLLSKTRYEWTLLDYAIWFAGAVTVPIYETSSVEQIAWILSDSEASAVIVETREHGTRVAESRHTLPALNHVWSLEDRALEDLASLGADISDEQMEERRTAVTPLSLATLIYTSGTTGRPKGCMLTHGNFMFELGVAVDELEELFDHEDASTLLFLPLGHVFARIIQIGCVKARVRLGHSSNIKSLLADLEVFKPTFILAVPRVFEKLFNTASQNAAADGRGKIFDKAADTAIAYSRALEAGKPSLILRARHKAFDRLVYAKLREALGGACAHAIAGGAPLGERLGHFFRGVGLPVLEGYGLTETTAAVTVNLPNAQKVGTVGRPIGGTSVRVAEDGELMFKGGQIFPGYWNDEPATKENLESDGWFHTGDVGEIDDEGFVRVTGRKKEILVTAGGKNVAPAVLEDRIRAHYLISQCLVVGDGQPFVGALITIDVESFRAWAESHRKSGDISDHVEDEDLREEVAGAVEEANKTVSQAESIRKFAILPMDWTEEGGQLTPSLKLKRNVVMHEFREDVELLYAK